MKKADEPVVERDIVLIYFENSPVAFARVESITADRKKDWYQVELLLLGIPLHTVTWILREEYINGAEFTMEGNRVRLEKVAWPYGTSERRKGDGTARVDADTVLSGGKNDDKGKVIRFPGKKQPGPSE